MRNLCVIFTTMQSKIKELAKCQDYFFNAYMSNWCVQVGDIEIESPVLNFTSIW